MANSTPLSGILFCGLIIAIATIAIQQRDSPPFNEYLPKKVSSTKPYLTFEQFYPHYLSEHSKLITRQWHYVGTALVILYLLFNPILLMPILAAGTAGYSAVPFLRHIPNGSYEAGLLLAIYLIGSVLSTRSLTKSILPLILGYSFAWVGHFYFEFNKPATFIYPTYSLMGDFRMMYGAIKEQFS